MKDKTRNNINFPLTIGNYSNILYLRTVVIIDTGQEDERHDRYFFLRELVASLITHWCSKLVYQPSHVNYMHGQAMSSEYILLENNKYLLNLVQMSG